MKRWGMMLILILILPVVFMLSSTQSVALPASDGCAGVWRLDTAYNQDGEECTIEECGGPFELAVLPDGQCFLITQSGLYCTSWQYKGAGQTTEKVFVDGLHITLSREENKLKATKLENEGLSHSTLYFTFVSEAGQRDELVGKWKLANEIQTEDESVQLVVDMLTGDEGLYMSFDEDGYIRLVSEALELATGLFGDDVAVLGQWIQLDDRILLLTEDGAAVFKCEIKEDTIRLLDIRGVDVLDEYRLVIPIHYDSAVRFEKESGILSAEYTKDDIRYVRTFDLSADGSGILTVSDALFMPETIYEKKEFTWKPFEDGLLLCFAGEEGEVELTTRGRDALGRSTRLREQESDYREDLWRMGAYERLLDSAQTKRKMDVLPEYIGQWYAEDVMLDDGRHNVMFSLAPDGTAKYDWKILTEDPREGDFGSSSTSWRMTDSGIEIGEYTDSLYATALLDENILRFNVNGTTFAAEKVADRTHWYGDAFHADLSVDIIDYSQSGFVGVWRGTEVEYERTPTRTLYLAADGTGMTTYKDYSEEQSDLLWKLASDGISVYLFEEVGAVSSGQWINLRVVDWNDSNELKFPNGWHPVGLTKVTDYWIPPEEGGEEALQPIVEYEVLQDGTIMITNWFGGGKNISLPDTIDGYRVSVIGPEAFKGKLEIESVVIPEGVKEISPSAFETCEKLSSVTFPQSLEKIGGKAFRGDASLDAVILHGSPVIGAQAFQSSGVSSVNFTGKDVVLDNGAFSACRALRTVTWDALGAIGGSAFEGCRELESIVIPASARTVGERAFYGCGAQTLEIAEGVTSIGASAFEQCKKIERAVIPNSVTDVGISAFKDCTGLTQAVIGNGVTALPDEMFLRCGLSEITFPETLQSIGVNAFGGCESLYSLRLPNSLVELGNSAFRGCTNLRTITLPQTLSTIGSYAFAQCKSLKALDIPDCVAEIGDWIFDGQTDVVMTGSAGSVAETYASANGLRFEIREEAQSEGASENAVHAFDETQDFLYERRPDGTLAILAYKGAAQDVIVPSEIGGAQVSEIGADAFSENETLKSVTVCEGVRVVGDTAFFNCNALETVWLPESAVEFGRFVFTNCPNLTVVVKEGSAAQQYVSEMKLNYEATTE